MTIKQSELKQIIREMLREELKVIKLHESVDWAATDAAVKAELEKVQQKFPMYNYIAFHACDIDNVINDLITNALVRSFKGCNFNSEVYEKDSVSYGVAKRRVTVMLPASADEREVSHLMGEIITATRKHLRFNNASCELSNYRTTNDPRVFEMYITTYNNLIDVTEDSPY